MASQQWPVGYHHFMELHRCSNFSFENRNRWPSHVGLIYRTNDALDGRSASILVRVENKTRSFCKIFHKVDVYSSNCWARWWMDTFTYTNHYFDNGLAPFSKVVVVWLGKVRILKLYFTRRMLYNYHRLFYT